MTVVSVLLGAAVEVGVGSNPAPLRVPTHIETNIKVYFFIKRLQHTDAHFSLLLSA